MLRNRVSLFGDSTFCVRVALCMLLVICMTNPCDAQMSRRKIKSNNRRIGNYRGERFTFGKEKRYVSASFTVNALNYYGDLSPNPSPISTDLALTRPAFGISLSKRRGPRFTMQANFMYGEIRGSDSKSANQNDVSSGVFRYNRNLSFRNRIKELSFVTIFDYFENHSMHSHRVQWTPFVFAGIAIFHHNPKAKIPRTDLHGVPFARAMRWTALQPLGTEGQFADLLPTDVNFGVEPYKRVQPGIPFGFGIRFKIKHQMDFSIEYASRLLFTDYLDDVSRNYVDLGIFGNNELAKALSYRSNEVLSPNHTYTSARDGGTYTVVSGYGAEHGHNYRGHKDDNDTFFVLTLKYSFILPSKFSRPKFR